MHTVTDIHHMYSYHTIARISRSRTHFWELTRYHIYIYMYAYCDR